MFNKAILIGRLTKDPELKTSQSGVSVCAISLAVARRFANQNGERETDFIDCVAFRQTADFISRYFTKGRMLGVSGSIRTRHWDDQDGKRHYRTEVVIDEAFFVDSKKDDSQQGSNTGSAFQDNDGYKNNNNNNNNNKGLPDLPDGFGGGGEGDFPF